MSTSTTSTTPTHSVIVSSHAYPIYSSSLTRRGHILLGGGGGKGNYGVPNTLELMAIVGDHGRSLCSVVEPDGAFNNVAAHPRDDIVAAGVDNNLHLYTILGCEPISTATPGRGRRNRSLTNLPALAAEAPSFQPLGVYQTDFANIDPLQRAVKFSPDGSRIATGGADGVVRLWAFPTMTMQRELRGLNSSVADLDFDPSATRVVAVGETSRALIWRTIDGSVEQELEWFHDTGLDAAHSSLRACRFSGGSGAGASGMPLRLMTLARAPVGKKQLSFVLSFETMQWKEKARQSCGPNGLCALTASHDGRYVGVGDLEGFVYILSSVDLRVLVKSKAHGIFVTSVSFLPTMTDNAGTSLVSVSADRACAKTKLEGPRGSYDIIFLFLIIVIALCLMFYFFSRATASVIELPEQSSHTEV